VITATHRRLLENITEKTFREDLYYRLNVVHIEVPPLRDRREDIPVLLNHFLHNFAETYQIVAPEVAADAADYLGGYNWPGNVRELRNVAERLILKARDGRITAELLPTEITRDQRPRESVTVAAAPALTPNSQILFDRMFSNGASFWSEVYEPFMARDLTRNDVRDVVRLGLEHTRGNYKMLVQCFNMPPEDYKKFLNFLRKYQCHVPFQRFRMMPATMARTPQVATA